jgi:S-DNA-T family DNA segregation ATPase FtsK/SpoIIIE
LIAGTTGSGKSVGVNAMILSILYRLPPDKCKFIMIDPKMLELSVYDGIPHLLAPVVTDPKKAIVALKWTVREMEDRYRRMSKIGVRNIGGFNEKANEALAKGEHFVRTVQTGFDEAGRPVYEEEKLRPDPMPYLVVVIDEVADLMMVAGKDIEGAVQRLAQMARTQGWEVPVVPIGIAYAKEVPQPGEQAAVWVGAPLRAEGQGRQGARDFTAALALAMRSAEQAARILVGRPMNSP